MKFQAIIFDLDGTLLDTILDLANSLNCVLERNGLPVHSVSAYKRFVGNGLEMLIQRSLPEADQANVLLQQRCLAQMREEYERRRIENTRPYPGIPQLLTALTERGLLLSILSNKQQYFTTQIVQKLLADWPFVIVLGAREGVPKKPDPTAALEIANQLGVPPPHFLYVGDSGVDMQTAVGAGMSAVGVTWGFREEVELWENGAKWVIHQPLELLTLLS